MGEKEGYLPFLKGFETLCVHHGQEPSQWKSKSVVPQIVMSTIYQLEDPTKPWKYAYGRIANPTRHILEKLMAKLNTGKYGLCFASGMSAMMAVLALLKKGEHIVCGNEMSAENYEIFNKIASNFSIRTTFVDFTKAASICEAIQNKTKLLWTENPSDPTMKIYNINMVAKIAKEHKILFGVDNTYLTPYMQRPLEMGADLVMQSLSKYADGHTDSSVGCLSMCSDELLKKLHITQTVFGMVPSPFDCYQVIRGIKTLNLRMDEHHKHSLTIAHFLEKHPAVEKVIHPGLPSHPQHELFKKQASGHSGIISFYLKGGLEGAKKFVKNLKCFTISEVAGGVESTIQIPFIMSHKKLTKSQKEELNILENLIKLSIGLENICDLITDLEQALDMIKSDSDEFYC